MVQEGGSSAGMFSRGQPGLRNSFDYSWNHSGSCCLSSSETVRMQITQETHSRSPLHPRTNLKNKIVASELRDRALNRSGAGGLSHWYMQQQCRNYCNHEFTGAQNFCTDFACTPTGMRISAHHSLNWMSSPETCADCNSF